MHLLNTASKFALFSASSLKDKKLIKKQAYTKTEKPILKSFEYFCQISSKSIVIILSYTVSKLARFLRHSVDIMNTTLKAIGKTSKLFWENASCWFSHGWSVFGRPVMIGYRQQAVILCKTDSDCWYTGLSMPHSLPTAPMTSFLPWQVRLSIISDTRPTITDARNMPRSQLAPKKIKYWKWERKRLKKSSEDWSERTLMS